MNHTVTRGETLSRIAARYGVGMAAILGVNPQISDRNRLLVGQDLLIPQDEPHRRPAAGGIGRPAQGRVPPQVWSFKDTFFEMFPLAVPSPPARTVSPVSNQPPPPPGAAAAPPPWMATAHAEIGIAEYAGMHNANPRIMEYFAASRYWGTDDTSAVNAWCGSFVAWVMQQHGYRPVRAAYRARSWRDFGKRINEPVYGAIGIKSRTGGGHVSFVEGKNASGDKLFMLGGNQGNRVQISEYARSVWSTFVVPPDYDETQGQLPVYSAQAAAAGSEA